MLTQYTLRQLGLRETGIKTSKAKCLEVDANLRGKDYPILIWVPVVFLAPPENSHIKTWAVPKVKQKIFEAYQKFKESQEVAA